MNNNQKIMNIQISWQKIITVTVSSLLLASGCGFNKQNISKNNQSLTNLTLGSQQSLAECSIDMSQNPELGIKLQVLDDPQFGKLYHLIRVKFIRIPDSFGSQDQHALQLWTRTITPSNTWGEWQNVRFYFQRRVGESWLRTPYSYQDITWEDMKRVAQYLGISVSDAKQFFSQIELVAILDQEGNAKIITPSLYLSNDSIKFVTALAPLFDANPNRYTNSKPSNLSKLHPLQSLIGTDFSDGQFLFEIQKFCL
ncbi:MAG: hypothetical protein NZ480_08925 [Bdellovibrionaceae bacterium]|nr:hypothetical protein [Pseudobdellovibrionaceae bacterium]MDW8189406.1 hypothetical protein [Pseudobdellovibrionaceae bacterium]